MRPKLAGALKPQPTTPMTWADRASCKGTDPSAWVAPGAVRDVNEHVTPWHRDHCETCPVIAECLAWAVQSDEHGVWAATTRHERKQLQRREQRRGHMARTRAERREAS